MSLESPAPEEGRGNMKGLVLFVVAGLLLCLLLAMPLILQQRELARRNQCADNLRKKTVAALTAFETASGAYPPAYMLGPDDKEKWHSWRSLIVPLAVSDPIYQTYDLLQSWDSPANQPLLAQVPAFLKCPSHNSEGQPQTSYSAVTGSGTIFEKGERVTLKQITDGAEYTLIVGEVYDLAIPWTEPKDVDIDQTPRIATPGGFQSGHGLGANFAAASGSVKFYSERMDPKLFKSLCLRSDAPAAAEAPTEAVAP